MLMGGAFILAILLTIVAFLDQQSHHQPINWLVERIQQRYWCIYRSSHLVVTKLQRVTIFSKCRIRYPSRLKPCAAVLNRRYQGSSEIALGNTDLSARTEQQAASLEQTAASMSN